LIDNYVANKVSKRRVSFCEAIENKENIPVEKLGNLSLSSVSAQKSRTQHLNKYSKNPSPLKSRNYALVCQKQVSCKQPRLKRAIELSNGFKEIKSNRKLNLTISNRTERKCSSKTEKSINTDKNDDFVQSDSTRIRFMRENKYILKAGDPGIQGSNLSTNLEEKIETFVDDSLFQPVSRLHIAKRKKIKMHSQIYHNETNSGNVPQDDVKVSKSSTSYTGVAFPTCKPTDHLTQRSFSNVTEIKENKESVRVVDSGPDLTEKGETFLDIPKLSNELNIKTDVKITPKEEDAAENNCSKSKFDEGNQESTSNNFTNELNVNIPIVTMHKQSNISLTKLVPRTLETDFTYRLYVGSRFCIFRTHNSTDMSLVCLLTFISIL